MRVIIAGGRDYTLTDEDHEYLDEAKRLLPITSVVCGMARGADMGGHAWAKSREIPIDEHPARWDLHGRYAGPIRNREMGAVADALIAFPGGRGTADMIRVARQRGMPVMQPGIKEGE